MVTVYGMKVSGNCYKVQLLLEQLGQPYRWVEINSLGGQTRTPEFLAKNPNGRVPLLELEDGRLLPESNAMLWYLAEGSPMLSDDRWLRAQVLQWMFFEQYSHEPYVAVARMVQSFLPDDHPRKAELPRLRERGVQALGVMQQQLAQSPFIAGDTYSIADIALYAYTHVADTGGFDLNRFPAIQAWLARVGAQPGYVAIGS
jgi:glutathione S-transferase